MLAVLEGDINKLTRNDKQLHCASLWGICIIIDWNMISRNAGARREAAANLPYVYDQR